MKTIRLVAALAAASAAPAGAEVVQSGEQGFVLRFAADVPASANQSWQALVNPAGWWSGQHTYSGDAANLTIEPRAGGCFCEALPAGKGAGRRARPIGSVEHMRVLFAQNDRQLRMSGALGPLQAEALQGTLTVSLTPQPSGTRIEWIYMIGGFMRMKADQIAPAVDRVLGEQFASLTARLGGSAAPPKPGK